MKMAAEIVNNLGTADNKLLDKENPFSFSKFVQRGNVKINDGNCETSTSSDNILPKTPNSAGIGAEGGTIGANTGAENPFSLSSFIQKARPSKSLKIVDDAVQEAEQLTESGQSDSDSSAEDDYEGSAALENSPRSGSYVLPSRNTEDAQTVLANRIQELEDNNRSLKGELEKLKEEFLEYRSSANKRIGSLQKELAKARQKEVEETRAMEDVVRMVEENLRTTTQRAVKAETTAARLRDELLSLQEESVPRSVYNQLIRDHSLTLLTIRDKSKGAADLMRSAAEKTEPHLRQLTSGVSTLRLLADQFDDLGKITELPHGDLSKNTV